MKKSCTYAPNLINYKKLSHHKHFLSLFLFLITLISYSQTPTDNCGTTVGAELTVTSTCSFITWDSTTNGNYWTSGNASCQEGYSRDDIWGWFTATSTSTTITYSPDTRRPILTLFQANCSNGMTSIACDNAGSNGTDATITYATTIGTVYKIRVQRHNSNANMTGDICVYNTPAPPSNDLCSNATPLTVNNSCVFTTYTNENATDSGETPAPGCANYLGGDVWFSVTVPTSGELNIDSNTGVITNGGMAVYSGSCGALSLLACDSNSSTNGDMPYISLTGQTPGATLYIRFYERGNNNNGTFDICITNPNPACTTPTAQPTTLNFGTVTTTTIDGTFTAASPTPDNYLVVSSTSSTPPSPVNTTTYNIGDSVGSGYTVVDNDSNTSFSATGLTNSTTYYFYIFSYNNVGCSGGPVYNSVSSLTGNQATVTPAPCTTPTTQASNLTFGTITNSTIAGSFSAATPIPDSYLVVANTTNITPNPTNTTSYNIGDIIGAGNIVIDNDSDTSFNASGLSSSTLYYFFIFSFNNSSCMGGPLYNTASTLSNSFSTNNISYCIPSSTNTNNYINDFSTTGGSTNITNNSSGYSTGGYGDFTGLAVTQIAGGTVNFSSTFIGTGVPTFGANIWVDYNNNGDFTDAGEQVFGSGAYVTGITGSFVIPGATASGSYRMRILIDYFDTNPDSCDFSTQRGEAEDYTLIVGTPPPCSIPIAQATAITFNSITSSTIAGSFTAASPNPDDYLIVMNTTGIPPTPINTTSYNIGDTIGAGNIVIDNDNDTVFSASGLSITTTYYFYIFSFNNLNCTGGPLYNTISPLTGNATTSSIATYCEPASTIDEANLYIDDVEFIGTLNDVSNLSSSYSSTGTVGFQDWTSLTNSIQAQGEGINVSIESGTYRGHFKVWVDWDLDGLFEETASELVFDSGSIATSSTTFGFIVPSNQATGEYRLRIKFYNSFSGATESYVYDFDSCEDFNTNGSFSEYGETEDYTFTVVQSCAATIDSITEGDNCGAGTVNLSVTGSSGTIQYNWYDSAVAVTPIATTASGNWITPSINSTTTYYVTADNGSCESLVRTELTATIHPVTTLNFSPSVPEVCGEDDIIQISATSEDEVAYLINEDFEGSGLGTFTNNNIRDHSASESAMTMWQQRTSTYIPSEQVWFPAISSGFGTNKFAMATSDTGTSNITENALESATIDSSNFTDLTLTFDLYFSRYLFIATIPEDVNVEVSTNGGTSWTTIQTYDDDIGYGTNMANISLNLDAYINETDLKVRIRYFADYWCDGVAVDNIKLFGSRPLLSSFTWTSSTTIDAYLDAAATIPYTGTQVNSVYIKPTTTQLQSSTFSFVATVSLDNGCDISSDLTFTNRTKFWNGGASTDWNNAANWLPNGIPTANDCVVIPDQTIISGTNYNAYAKNLTVKPTGDLELQSENNLIVTDWVTVDTNGVFDIRDSASLVQINNDANSGIVRINRNTQPIYRYDYTYWGSPLTTASNFKLLDLSPDTLGDKFFRWQPTIANGHGNWILQNATSTDMVNGTGYAIRAPQTFSADSSVKTIYTGTFTGTPANGDINIPITIGTDANIGTTNGDTTVGADDDQWHLIGNPYPSAIDVVSFLNNATNTALLDGTVYLWTHNTPPSEATPDPFYADFGANYTGSDYATVNSLGTSNTAASGGITPSRYIASGQSFFVMGLNNGTAVFDNTMRVSNLNNIFLRTTEETQNIVDNFERHRIWLNLSNESEAFSQVLIGYAEGATLGWDRGLDGLVNNGNFVSFYSITPSNNLTIQGRPLPFNDSDIVPLGYNATVANSYRIGIDHIDPLFLNQDIFLKDKDLNYTHNLKSSPYIFSSEIGTFDNRFELIYKDETLSIEEVTINENAIKVIEKEEILNIISTTKYIKAIEVYDVLARIISQHNDINTKELSLEEIRKDNRMLLLKITLKDNSIIYKKVLY